MSFNVFLWKCAIRFFIITTCVNVLTAILGPILLPDITLTFNVMYSPVFAGAISTLPSFILYSRKELNLRQTILRKVAHLIVLVTILTIFAWLFENISTAIQTFIFVGGVVIVYTAVTLISWTLQLKDANDINKGLKSLQGRK